MDIVLVKAVQTCVAAPCQWNAWDVNGRYYYLWFRGGIGWIGHSYDKNEAIASFEYDEYPDISLEEFCALLQIRWQSSWYIPGMTLEEPYKMPESIAMNRTCNTKMMHIRMWRRCLDFVKYGHSRHTCVITGPFLIPHDGYCRCRCGNVFSSITIRRRS